VKKSKIYFPCETLRCFIQFRHFFGDSLCAHEGGVLALNDVNLSMFKSESIIQSRTHAHNIQIRTTQSYTFNLLSNDQNRVNSLVCKPTLMVQHSRLHR